MCAYNQNTGSKFANKFGLDRTTGIPTMTLLGFEHLSSVGELVCPRKRHVSVRLTAPWGYMLGKVLAIGGDVTGGAIFGGAQRALDSLEIYDPATGQFSFFGTMTVARQNHTATELPDGRILIAGGVGRFFVSSTAELLNPQARGLIRFL